MAFRNQNSNGPKPQLKEKVIQIYESFFKGENVSKDNDNFWNEFFLLKPKVSFFETEIEKLSIDQLISLQDNIRQLFIECINIFECQHKLRTIFSLKTITCLVSSLYKKFRINPNFDFISILVAQENTNIVFKDLLEKCNIMLRESECVVIKDLCLQFLLAIVTGNDNLNENPALCYFMDNSIFESLTEELSNSIHQSFYGCDSILLLTFLMNVEIPNKTNPYIVKLSLLDKESCLKGYSEIIRWSLEEICSQYHLENQAHYSNNTFLNTITTAFNKLFVPDISEHTIVPREIRSLSGILIAMFEAINYNRNFMTYYELSPKDMQQKKSNINDLKFTNQFTNLLVTYFKYCSIVMQDIKTENNSNNAMLCFIILSNITDDQFANSLLHDVNLQFKVDLYGSSTQRYVFIPDNLKPLASALLDLMIQFILKHMMKNLPLNHYMICIRIIHKIICYQKRNSVRLSYDWKNLWNSLIILLKFLVKYELQLIQNNMNIYDLEIQIVNIFNLFITYGDMILPSPTSYDELYYEIIRMHTVFDNVYVLSSRNSSVITEYKLSAKKLSNCLINIRAIINHYIPKIDNWMEKNDVTTPLNDEILEVLRNNYDTLTLKLLDCLGSVEPKKSNYDLTNSNSLLNKLIIKSVKDTRQSLKQSETNLQEIIQNFSLSNNLS